MTKIKDMMAHVKIIQDSECPDIYCACITNAPQIMKDFLEESFSPENMNEDCGLQQFQKEMIARLIISELKDKTNRLFSSTNVCVGSYNITNKHSKSFSTYLPNDIGMAVAIYNSLIQFHMLARVVVESVMKQMGGEKYYSTVLKEFYNKMDNDKIYEEIDKLLFMIE